MKNRLLCLLTVGLLSASCATHRRSHIESREEFIVELKRPNSRGGVVETALQGLFLGAKYLADKTAKSLTSSYSQSISVNDYYSAYGGKVSKSYDRIDIKKYSKPLEKEENQFFMKKTG